MNSTVATLAAAPGGAPGGGNFQPGQMPQGGVPGGMRFGGPMGGRGGLFGPWLSIGSTLVLVVTLVVLAIVFWKLFQRTGKSGALGLLMLIPVVNLGVMLWFAFSEWSIDAELQRLKALFATRPPSEVE